MQNPERILCFKIEEFIWYILQKQIIQVEIIWCVDIQF